MHRPLVSLLVLLGLLAASAHAPAMALPEPFAPAPSATAGHADCHDEGAGAAVDEAKLPTCCPDGCSGGCLLPGAMMPARGLAARIAVRTAPRLPPGERPARAEASGPFHPPRAFA